MTRFGPNAEDFAARASQSNRSHEGAGFLGRALVCTSTMDVRAQGAA